MCMPRSREVNHARVTHGGYHKKSERPGCKLLRSTVYRVTFTNPSGKFKNGIHSLLCPVLCAWLLAQDSSGYVKQHRFSLGKRFLLLPSSPQFCQPSSSRKSPVGPQLAGHTSYLHCWTGIRPSPHASTSPDTPTQLDDSQSDHISPASAVMSKHYLGQQSHLYGTYAAVQFGVALYKTLPSDLAASGILRTAPPSCPGDRTHCHFQKHSPAPIPL